MGGKARIIMIYSYMETLNHTNYCDWLHFYLPPFTREKKAFGHCWDQTRASCVASDRVIHYFMPLGLVTHWLLSIAVYLAKLTTHSRFKRKRYQQLLNTGGSIDASVTGLPKVSNSWFDLGCWIQCFLNRRLLALWTQYFNRYKYSFMVRYILQKKNPSNCRFYNSKNKDRLS